MKRWLLLNQPFALKREVINAYLLKESPERLWTNTCEAAMLRHLKSWTLQFRWQPYRLEKMARMLVDHLEGVLNDCGIQVR